ncbi:hypothetical protein W97_06929 [Coniosporium apollinis CBS 100218]|uniref:Uncharacterized protein n=1 Tax=Coniosporium apollinis (strain CBS 100218) TaxID=1168221 RepID=R7Z0X5_CONA1|nr:uncharacterized protein W97_06929 [Coniosporium apollinis CBS 100218]EON67561.1 hypothetical protein W97_06929 [Coniosporium apollinis CBS 100218]
MTIASIVEPHWLRWDSPTGSGNIHQSLGLHRKCNSFTGTCEHFPQYEDCHGDDRPFCSLWRTVGFLMSFSVIVELALLVAYAVVILGGKQKRDQGWKIVCSLLVVAAAAQCASMAVVAGLLDRDDRFIVGWALDRSWILCTVSWSVLAMSAAGLLAATIYMPEEGDYELIPGN